MKRFLILIAALTFGSVLFCSCERDPHPEEDNTNIPLVPISLTKGEQEVANSANAFGLNVYRALYQEDQMLFSPLSLSLALSMTACGADGTTAEQMSSTLGFNGIDPEDIAGYYNKMTGSLSTIDKKTTFESANSIWIDNSITAKESFLNTARKNFGAEIWNLDFSAPSSVDKINSWCSEKTHGKISKMFDKLNPDIVMGLLNALYFKGIWSFEFDGKTTKEIFSTIDGATSKVDMMHADTKLSGCFYNGWSAMRLPYGNGAFSMEVILPPAGMPFSDAVNSFDSELWSNLLNNSRTYDVTLKMPEFKFDSNIDEMKDILSDLGMPEAFTDDANFTKMAELRIGGSLYISSVKQKCSIEVNTKGTEAVVVTAVMMGYTSTAYLPEHVEFTVDRPFIFVIRENTTGSILFIGQKVR